MDSFFSIKIFTNPTNKGFFLTNRIDCLRINLMSYIIFQNCTWESCDCCFYLVNRCNFLSLDVDRL